jgi:lipoprotein Spr
MHISLLILSTLTLTILSFSVFGFELPPELSGLQKYSTLETVTTRGLSDISRERSLRLGFMKQYQKWRGTRYHYGGNTPAGVDCSALMQHFFRDVASLRLPRTTGEQIRRGVSISRSELRIGDLVFFNSGPQNRHVGVYIGDNEFIHASSTKGVTISKLDNQHWDSRFMAARRVKI